MWIALTILAPGSAAAAWGAHGSIEPNTPDDDPTLMWGDAPGPAQSRVYFQVITYARDEASGARVNPNSALLRTTIESPVAEFHEAILGVWADCNGDGFIGHADSAAREYPATLLLDASVCSSSVGSSNRWSGAHNYNGWVSELIPIGRYPGIRDARVIGDDDARVWGDYGKPSDEPGHRSCPLTTFPRGTWASTGGVLSYLDCRAQLVPAFNAGVDAVDDPLGLRFADDEPRAGVLGQISTFGEEDRDSAALWLADCGAPPLAVVTVTPEVDVVVRPPPPGPVRNIEGASIAASWNEAQRVPSGDCSDERGGGTSFYAGLLRERDVTEIDPDRKAAADWNFAFVTRSRGGFPASVVPGGSGNAGMPESDGGVGNGGSRWVADSVWITKPGPGIVRVDLARGSELAEPHWLSFFAQLGSQSLSRGLALPGGSGVYGAAQCGAQTSGVRQGWECDPSAWYLHDDGSSFQDPHLLARVGMSYQLRDVDCYDGRIGDTGMGIQAAFYGPEPCPFVG